MKKLFFGMLFGLASAIAAAEPQYRPSYDECLNKAVSSADMQACVRQELVYQDGRLNAVYQALRRQYQPAQRKLFQEAQQGWNVYKEKSAKLIASNEGSMYRVTAAGHYLALTAERADELEKELADLRSRKP